MADMGIEADALVLFLIAVPAAALIYGVYGFFLLRGAPRSCRYYFAGSAAAFLAAFLVLFGFYFLQPAGPGAADMTGAIGLSLLAWVVGLAFVVRLIRALRR